MRTVKRLLEISSKDNLAEDIDEQRLNEIGQFCLSGYEVDINTCKDHFSKLDEYEKIAAQEIEQKSFPWENCANVKFPILTVASIQFNARAYPQLVPAQGVAKAIFYGEDQGNIKADRTERVSKHISYQVREQMKGWEEDTDSLLLQVPTLGNLFRKTYHDQSYSGPRSVMLKPQQLIVNNDEVKTLEDCPRSTEIFKRYPYQIQNNIDSGIWIDPDIEYEEKDKHELQTLYEQHVIMELYEDGEMEPYIVTLTEEGKVLRIKACYDASTIYVDLGGEVRSVEDINFEIDSKNLAIKKQNIETKQIAVLNGSIDTFQEVPLIKKPSIDKEKPVRLDKIEYYTSYSFFPSFNGKFYKDGLASLIASLSASVDTNINQMLDAGTLQNMNSFMVAKTGKTVQKREGFIPGEGQTIDTGGRPIRDMIYPLDFKGPSTGLFSLLGLLIEAAKDITSVKDIMVGDAPQGETATTTMIKEEQGMKVFSAVYLRLYKSMTSELKKIYRLNRKYLTNEEYFRFGDSESYVKKQDYEDTSLDVIPTANPKESNTTQKILKAQVLMEASQGDPDADHRAIKQNYLEAAGLSAEEYKRFFPGPKGPPQPNTEDIKNIAEAKNKDADTVKKLAEAEKTAEETNNTRSENALTQAKVIDTIASAEAKEVGTQLDQYTRVAESIQDGLDRDQQRRDQRMETAPGDNVGVQEDVPAMESGGITDILAANEGTLQ